MKKKRTERWILGKIRKRIPSIVLLTVCHMGASLLGVAFALMCKNMIDYALAGDSTGFFHACLYQGTIILSMLGCTILNRHFHGKLSADMDRDFKRGTYRHLINGDYMSVCAYHSGDMINRLTSDVRVVEEGVLSVVPNVAAMITKLIAAAAALIVLDPIFTLVVAGIGVIILAVSALLRKRLKAIHRRVREEDGKVSSFLQETLEKVLMVQALDVSEQMLKRADERMEGRYRAQMKSKNVSLVTNAGLHFLLQASSFIALIWCSVGLFMGALTPGMLTAITQLVGQLQRPFVGMSGILPQYMSMLASAERLMELEEIESEPTERISLAADDMAVIGAQDLQFTYDRDEIFSHADFEVPTNGFTVVVGASGIGKSTLLKLMLGILHPQQGSLYVAGKHGRTALDRKTRGGFAYVPQGNLLLSGTLRENLTVTRPDATEDEVAQAIHVSAMDDYIATLPQGIDTVIGENGVGLSEGQSQRLAIARAVLGGAPILLLDECTSALDEQTEKTVLERLKALPGRACIAVTHRPAAKEICDRILMVKDGKIIAMRANDES